MRVLTQLPMGNVERLATVAEGLCMQLKICVKNLFYESFRLTVAQSLVQLKVNSI